MRSGPPGGARYRQQRRIAHDYPVRDLTEVEVDRAAKIISGQVPYSLPLGVASWSPRGVSGAASPAAPDQSRRGRAGFTTHCTAKQLVRFALVPEPGAARNNRVCGGTATSSRLQAWQSALCTTTLSPAQRRCRILHRRAPYILPDA
jgi:hypothetical protein